VTVIPIDDDDDGDDGDRDDGDDELRTKSSREYRGLTEGDHAWVRAPGFGRCR
jgi:hypothetical protein